MIRWTVTSAEGREYTLPHPSRWQLDYALGTPCDAFSLQCPWQGGQEALLGELCRVVVREGAQVLFTGLVDECECRWSERGALLEISGRGMQALLLDHEAPGVDFSIATQAEILRRYVSPYGIETLGGALPPVSAFSVSSGSSCWQVLCRFAHYYAGATPRFDRQGRLLLSPLPQKPSRLLDGRVPIKALTLRHKRYGALSEVTVINRVSKQVQRITDPQFSARGGSASRVITMPRIHGSQAMRYNGEYLLRRSQEELFRVEMQVAEPFLAEAGEILEIRESAWPLKGLWRVLASRVTLDEGGYTTLLTLAPPEALT